MVDSNWPKAKWSSARQGFIVSAQRWHAEKEIIIILTERGGGGGGVHSFVV